MPAREPDLAGAAKNNLVPCNVPQHEDTKRVDWPGWTEPDGVFCPADFDNRMSACQHPFEALQLAMRSRPPLRESPHALPEYIKVAVKTRAQSKGSMAQHRDEQLKVIQYSVLPPGSPFVTLVPDLT